MIVSIALAGLLLSACGRNSSTPAAVSGLSVIGTPSLNISVPLTTVGCTTTDYCLAVGTTTLESGATSAAQVIGPTGGWHSITIAPISAGSVSRIACGAHTCLIYGRNATGPLLFTWSVGDAGTTAVPLPDTFLGLADLTCSASTTLDICTAVSDSEPPAFAVSQNFGRTWTPLTLLSQWLTTTAAQVVDARCSTASCATVGSVPTGLSYYQLSPSRSSVTTSTLNSPTSSLPTRSSSTTSSLPKKTFVATWCDSLSPVSCTLVVRGSPSSTAALSISHGKKHQVVVPAGSTIACAAHTGCAALTASGPIAAANWQHTLHVTQTYVPDRFVSVACGRSRCAAVSATTATYFRP